MCCIQKLSRNKINTKIDNIDLDIGRPGFNDFSTCLCTSKMDNMKLNSHMHAWVNMFGVLFNHNCSLVLLNPLTLEYSIILR